LGRLAAGDKQLRQIHLQVATTICSRRLGHADVNGANRDSERARETSRHGRGLRDDFASFLDAAQSEECFLQAWGEVFRQALVFWHLEAENVVPQILRHVANLV
jgi:hypothetical protein